MVFTYPAWFSALDRARIAESIKKAERLMTAPDVPGVITLAYPSDAVAVQAALLVIDAVKVTLTAHIQRPWPELGEAAMDLRDQAIAWVAPQRWPRQTTLDEFAACVRAAVPEFTKWASPPADQQKTIGEQLTALRKEAHWSVDDLAVAMATDKKNVHDHLNDEVTPRPKTLRDYQAVFGKQLRREVKIIG
jgi:hypothetical protein